MINFCVARLRRNYSKILSVIVNNRFFFFYLSKFSTFMKWVYNYILMDYVLFSISLEYESGIWWLLIININFIKYNYGTVLYKKMS